MNFEGKNKIDEAVLQAKGPRILTFIIRSSLFDIRYSLFLPFMEFVSMTL